MPLMHATYTLFPGLLYPSYTNSLVTKFRSPEAETAGHKFKELWIYTNRSSTNFFPVVEVELPDDMPSSVKQAGEAIAAMTGAADANPGLLPAFASVPSAKMKPLTKRIATLAEQVNYLVPSHDPSDSRYDDRRYWRGPA